MKKVVLMALLALALPVAAFANSVDFANQGGTISGSSAAGLSLSSTLIGVTGLPGCPCAGVNVGSVSITTGALLTGSLANGGTFGAGTISIVGNGSDGVPSGTLFSGTFTSVTWTLLGTNADGSHEYLLTGSVSGSGGSGFTFQGVANVGKGFFGDPGSGVVQSGDTHISTVVPEPGTLGLLGTGLVGIAGVVRRKIKLG